MSDLNNLAGRATVHGANEGAAMRTVQIEIFSGDVRDDIEHFEPYGFTSGVKPGSEGVAISFAGDRDHTIAVVIADRRYRMKVATGEVAVYDDIGQSIHLSRSGIKVDGGGNPITVSNTPKVDFDTPLLHVTGDMVADGQIKDAGGAKSMSGMRSTFDNHVHEETNTVTKKPNEAM